MNIANKALAHKVDNQQSPFPDSYQTPLIPVKNSLHGPITTARQQRLYYGYFTVFTLGCLLLLASTSPFWQTFGAGLIIPGGGFIAIMTAGDFWMITGHALLLVASVVGFIVALLTWVLTGNIIAPFVVWIGAAIGAAAMDHHHIWSGSALVVPAIPVFLTMIWIRYRRKALATALASRERRNAYLAQSNGSETTPIDKNGLPLVEELGEEDLSLLRYLLDRSLQPVSDVNGIDQVHQIR